MGLLRSLSIGVVVFSLGLAVAIINSPGSTDHFVGSNAIDPVTDTQRRIDREQQVVPIGIERATSKYNQELYAEATRLFASALDSDRQSLVALNGFVNSCRLAAEFYEREFTSDKLKRFQLLLNQRGFP
jgi:hypothetical protein